MITSTQALTAAHGAVIGQFPGRAIGNISVEPAGDHYHVRLLDLPRRGVPKRSTNGVQATIERDMGKITDIKEITLPKLPYVNAELPEATITGKEAFEKGFTALKGAQSYGKQGKLTVELIDQIYRVTFPLPRENANSRSADYAFQVWIHAQTGEVVKTFVAS